MAFSSVMKAMTLIFDEDLGPRRAPRATYSGGSALTARTQ